MTDEARLVLLKKSKLAVFIGPKLCYHLFHKKSFREKIRKREERGRACDEIREGL